MSSEHRVFANHLTFSQRHRDEPLPEPMKLKYLSDDLRCELCNAVHHFLRSYMITGLVLEHDWSSIGLSLITRLLGKFQTIPDLSVNTDVGYVIRTVQDIITNEPFDRVLDFLEILMDMAPNGDEGALAFTIRELFRKHASTYQLIICRGVPLWFHPCVSQEQAKAIRKAIETLDQGNFGGSMRHLRKAAEHINGKRYGNAIVDSIHAVESVARKIDPKSGTLGNALKSLKRRGTGFHPAFLEALSKLYGYTSDAAGLRHAEIEREDPSIGVDESVFMFGACASFAGYLARKHMAHECGEHPIADEGNLGKP